MGKLMKEFGKIATLTITFAVGNFIPKSKKIIVFSSRAGNNYLGNAGALYEYLKKDKYFECYYFFRDKKRAMEYSNRLKDKNILYVHTLRSILIILRAKTVILTHGLGDYLGIFLNPLTQNVIQTWHGLPSVKGGFLMPSTSKKELRRSYHEAKKYTAFLASSDLTKYIFCSRYYLDPRKIAITGCPRNDTLYHKQKKSELIDFLKGRYKELPSFNKIILYAPTWRRWGKTRFFPFDDSNLKEINDFLDRSNCLLFLRGHFNVFQASNIKFESSRILNLDPSVLEEIQSFLPFVDVLITDYSSIYQDFLILERPTIFIPYDLEKWEELLGIPLDYDFFAPGYKVKTQKEFLNALKTYLDNPEKHLAERKVVKKLLFKYDDGNSCERVRDLIIKLLKDGYNGESL